MGRPQTRETHCKRLTWGRGRAGLQTQAITVLSGTVDLVASPPPPVPPAPLAASAPQEVYPLVGPPVLVVGAPVPVPVPVLVPQGTAGGIPDSSHAISTKVFAAIIPVIVVALLGMVALGAGAPLPFLRPSCPFPNLARSRLALHVFLGSAPLPSRPSTSSQYRIGVFVLPQRWVAA